MVDLVIEEKKDVATVKLAYPIPVPKPTEAEPNKIEMIDTLTFRRLKVKDFKKMPPEEWEKMRENDKQDIISLLPFIAIAADIPVSSAEEIDIVDLQSVSEICDSFFTQAYQGIGKT